MVTCNETGEEADGIFQTKFSFKDIVFEYLRMFFTIHPDEEILDLLGELMNLMPVYDLPNLNVLSHVKSSDKLQKGPRPGKYSRQTA